MARTPTAPSIPANGRSTWRTPPEDLFLIHRIYGGPLVAPVAPMWQPGMWRLEDWRERYLEILAWLREQGTIQLDPCADRDDVYHYAASNTAWVGLDAAFPWNLRTFANVPYSCIKLWVEHGAAQAALLRARRETAGRGILFLIPATPSNKYWVDNMLCPGKLAHPYGPAVNIFATKSGRIGFIGPDGPVKNNTTGSALVGWIDPAMGGHAVHELESAGWSVHRRPAPRAKITLSPLAARPVTMHRGRVELAHFQGPS